MYLAKTAFVSVFVFCFSVAMTAQPQLPETARHPLDVRPMNRIFGRVDQQTRVTLSGNRHPAARPENLVGALAPDQLLEHAVLALRPDPAQEDALQELLRAQQDPESPEYHHWLTPREFGERFGISENDLAQIASWLESNGLRVDEIPASRRAIVFSGSAGQVESAFHTQMRRYSVNGQLHFANATDLEIPQALGEVVQGVVSLHDFHLAPAHTAAMSSPAYTLANGVNLLMPRDWATIYDVTPLYAQGIDGTGQSIAVVGRTDLDLNDLRTFRTNAGLPAKDPQKIFVNGVNPGWPDCQDEAETALDVEWAGALAKNATINFVSAQSGATDGVILAAQYAVTNQVSPIITVSYLHCEATLSDGGLSLWGSLWSEAALQGQTVFVSSGDSGAAGCDLAIAPTATQGRGVNAICSSPNSTCIGGTQFNDIYNQGTYWTATNGAGQSSVLSYIPEVAWNETAWSGMINTASGGGVSTVYAKPAWQSAPGVPTGTMRYVPDISASSAVHDAYVIQIQGKPFYVAGTSAASPSLASVLALVLQNVGGSLGNINPSLYTLATQQAAGGPPVFHDITSGNNSVPGVIGYNAGTGYDLVTGLGSVDAFLLVNSWANSFGSNFTLASNASNLSVSASSPKTVTLSMSAQGGFSAPVTLSAAGLPSGVTATFSSNSISAGTPVTLNLSSGATAAAGVRPIAVIASGGGFKRTLALNLTVVGPSFTLTSSPSGVSLTAGSSASVSITLGKLNGFNSAVAMTVSGAPAGVTATLSPASIPSGGSSSTLTLSASSTTTPGTYALSVQGVSGSIVQTQIVTLAIAAPSLTLAVSSATATVAQGGSTAVTLTTTTANGLTTAPSFTVHGLPTGVTAGVGPVLTVARGKYSNTLTFAATATATAGTYTITITGSSGTASQARTLSLTVAAASFTLTASATSVSVTQGGSLQITLTTIAGTGFKSAVVLSLSTLPNGVTASMTPSSIASPGTGYSTLKFSATTSATAGTSTVTVTAKGGTVTRTENITLTISAPSVRGHP